MERISKVIILAIATSAIAYTATRVRQCRLVGFPPPAASSMPSPPQQTANSTSAPSDLLYPSKAIVDQLNLRYEVFTRNDDGTINALPLPPGLAMKTTFVLHSATAGAWKASMLDPRCESDLYLKIYRPDTSTPQWQGTLKALGKTGDLPIDISSVADTGLALVTLQIDEKAKNNWFCNVLISGA